MHLMTLAALVDLKVLNRGVLRECFIKSTFPNVCTIQNILYRVRVYVVFYTHSCKVQILLFGFM